MIIFEKNNKPTTTAPSNQKKPQTNQTKNPQQINRPTKKTKPPDVRAGEATSPSPPCTKPVASGMQVLDYKTGNGKMRDPFLGMSAAADHTAIEYTTASNLRAAV